MSAWFVHRLQLARTITGMSFVITSGYRCETHNKAVGGVIRSGHTQGEAADVRAFEGTEVFCVVRALFAAGFRRIGVGSDAFVHVDVKEDVGQDRMFLYGV